MNKTIVLVSSNREISIKTQDTLAALGQLGARRLLQRGSPDVAFARCQALTWACNALRDEPERDMVLMLDDDIWAESDVAQALVDAARERGRACSAVYTTVTGKLAASRWPHDPGLWLTGLGCLAIPAKLLLELEQAAPSFEMQGHVYSGFTWCVPEKGQWIAEDYRLCMNLGGVHLLPLKVAHMKTWPLWPNENTLKKVAEGVEPK